MSRHHTPASLLASTFTNQFLSRNTLESLSLHHILRSPDLSKVVDTVFKKGLLLQYCSTILIKRAKYFSGDIKDFVEELVKSTAPIKIASKLKQKRKRGFKRVIEEDNRKRKHKVNSHYEKDIQKMAEDSMENPRHTQPQKLQKDPGISNQNERKEKETFSSQENSQNQSSNGQSGHQSVIAQIERVSQLPIDHQMSQASQPMFSMIYNPSQDPNTIVQMAQSESSNDGSKRSKVSFVTGADIKDYSEKAKLLLSTAGTERHTKKKQPSNMKLSRQQNNKTTKSKFRSIVLDTQTTCAKPKHENVARVDRQQQEIQAKSICNQSFQCQESSRSSQQIICNMQLPPIWFNLDNFSKKQLQSRALLQFDSDYQRKINRSQPVPNESKSIKYLELGEDSQPTAYSQLSYQQEQHTNPFHPKSSSRKQASSSRFNIKSYSEMRNCFVKEMQRYSVELEQSQRKGEDGVLGLSKMSGKPKSMVFYSILGLTQEGKVRLSQKDTQLFGSILVSPIQA